MTLNPLQLGVLMFFHPIDTLDYIKRNYKKMSILPVIVILFLIIAVRYFYILCVHIPLADIKIQQTNFILELARILIPLITWVISIYGITSVMYGETKLKTIFISSAYSFVPYIILIPLFTALSRILSLQEASLYNFLQTAMWIWILILLFVSVMEMNNYTFGKTILVCILSLIGVLFIWGVVLMIIALTFQIIGFVNELVKEYVFYNL